MTMTVPLFAAILAGSFQAPPPYQVLPVEPGLASIAARLEGKESAVWLEGDVLHLAAKGREPMQVTGGIQMPLKQVPESDLWVARLKMDGWDSAFISYAFLGKEFRPGIRFEFWRGKNAPPDPRRVEKPHRIETFETASQILGESRGVTVYLPPGEHKNLPAVVMADGGAASQWAMSLEVLIREGKVRPMAIIGIHSGGYKGDRSQPYDPKLDMRAREYLHASDPDRFKLHLKWVTDELLPEMAERFGISRKREDLAVAGFSNGGAFAASAGAMANQTFGAAIPLSVGLPSLGERPSGPLPKFFFAAGKLEAGFLRGTTQAYEKVKGWGAEAELEPYVAGHDPLMWEMAFNRFVQKVFPAR